jgi:hypothetical protein
MSVVTHVCDCGNPAYFGTAQKEGPNKGRNFFTCSERDCKFFIWADEEGTQRRAPGGKKRPAPMGAGSSEFVREAKHLKTESLMNDKTAQTLVECLASSCALAQATLEQAARHESRLRQMIMEMKKCMGKCGAGDSSDSPPGEATPSPAPSPKKNKGHPNDDYVPVYDPRAQITPSLGSSSRPPLGGK